MAGSPHPSLKTLDYSVLQQCMHCGMCLPTCPTFDHTRRERNSPRGRIALMREIADGNLSVSESFAEEMYYCLGCLACQSACPAGVNYTELFETARAEIEQQHVLASPSRQFYRWLALRVLFTRPKLLRAVGRALWFFQRSGLQALARKSGLVHMLPRSLRRLEPKAPPICPPFSDIRIALRESPAKPKYRVGLLTGCVQDLIYADVNRATADVLLRNGCEVVTPRLQSCCGSLHAHNGDLETARQLAERQLDAFNLNELDAIITNAGGCGSHLKRYSHLFPDGDHYAERARQWDEKVRDIHEWLVEIGFEPPQLTINPPTAAPARITYDDSCHLCHGQQVKSQPRQILTAMPDVSLLPLVESEWCCGAAGIYGITQPEESQRLLDRKLDHIAATGATILASANPGCLLQLQQGAAARENLKTLRIAHPISLLAEAYARETP
jgi:glycolate oxidase iron-sulfur subunit